MTIFSVYLLIGLCVGAFNAYGAVALGWDLSQTRCKIMIGLIVLLWPITLAGSVLLSVNEPLWRRIHFQVKTKIEALLRRSLS